MNATSTLSDLDEVLEYKNDFVIHCFLRDFDISFEEATDIFNETLKWLYLCAHNQTHDQHKIRLAITWNLTILDEMWHTFILCTKDYTEFCQKYFGFYIHHKPTSKEDKRVFEEEAKKDPEKFLNSMKDHYRSQLGYTYDVLGENTVLRWYEAYADRYAPAKLAELSVKKFV